MTVARKVKPRDFKALLLALPQDMREKLNFGHAFHYGVDGTGEPVFTFSTPHKSKFLTVDVNRRHVTEKSTLGNGEITIRYDFANDTVCEDWPKHGAPGGRAQRSMSRISGAEKEHIRGLADLIQACAALAYPKPPKSADADNKPKF